MTNVSCVHAVDAQDAPHVKRVGIERLNQAPHSRLDDAIGRAAEQLLEQIEQRSATAGSTPLGRVKVIPVERGDVEGYDVETKDEVKRAHRQEQRLVERYVEHMVDRGDTVVRHKIKVPAAKGSIFSDIFNETRGQLIEAKANSSRSSVRMAIGQLADYARFLQPSVRRAVLLDARPSDDLCDLLSRQGTAIIWPDGESFTDDAGGEFT